MTEETITQASRPDILRELLPRHNEPLIDAFHHVARLIGYAEDDRDCYLILHSAERGKYWATAVGGYHFLTMLKGQGVIRSICGQDWHDLWRISNDLTLRGVPETEKFEIILEPQKREVA